MADDADAASRTLKGSSVDGKEVEGDNVLDNRDEVVSCGDDDAGEENAATSGTQPPKKAASPLRTGLIVGLALLAGLVGLVGLLGYRAYESDGAQQQRELFLQVGRQGAINLTTIDYTRVNADIQRVLDSSTGTFHDDFQERSSAFAEVVKQAQSKSEGSVTEAGIESLTDDSAQVIVAVSVEMSNIVAQEQQPRHWRMRITVQSVGEGEAKVSNVGFVP